MRVFSYIFLLFLSTCLLETGGRPARSAEPPTGNVKRLKTLILTGKNNHKWKETTPVLKKILEESGRFDVVVNLDPSTLDAAYLANIDVIVSNWSNWPGKKRDWGPVAEKAVMNFVRGGKGFALFHAASACLYSWPEYHEMVGATWGKNTGHGKRHEFQVEIVDKDHPVTRGLKPFKITDELWHRMDKKEGLRVLCQAYSDPENKGSGEMEPMVFVNEWGKGRVFHLVLGHDAAAMSSEGWKTLLVRGAEWAATGKTSEAPPVDIGKALEALKQYKFGQERGPLAQIEGLVHKTASNPKLRKDLAGRMADLLGSRASKDCKIFLCEQLSLIGSKDEVSQLIELLDDKELGSAARSALERIPGEESLAAMIEALDGLKEKKLVGLINALGERGDRAAFEKVAAIDGSKNAAVAEAALDALPKIGDPLQTSKLLLENEVATTSSLRAVWGDALLVCAERLLAEAEATEGEEEEKKKKIEAKRVEAKKIYDHLFAPGNPKPIRVAAFLGRLKIMDEEEAAKSLVETLGGDDKALHPAAIGAIRQLKDPAVTAALSEKLGTFPPHLQTGVITALADRGDRLALPAVAEALQSENAGVRQAALRALGRLGDASTVPILTKQAAATGGADRDLARQSLARLRDKDADAALAQLLDNPDAKIRLESVLALTARAAPQAVLALLKAIEDKDAEVRKESVRGLGSLAGQEVLPTLIKALKKPGAGSESRGIENTIAAICRRTEQTDLAVEHIHQGFTGKYGEETQLRVSLARVMGIFGQDKSYPHLKNGLADKNAEVRIAAVRALSDWPDAKPLEDMLVAAKKPQTKLLALRGFAKLAQKAKDAPAERMNGLFEEALKIAGPRPDKALVGGLGNVHCLPAMQKAIAYLDREALADDAGLAVVRIAEAIYGDSPKEVRAALDRVLDKTSAKAVRDRAKALLIRLDKPFNLALGATASSPDGLEKDGNAGGDQAGIDGNPDTYWDEEDNQKLYRYKVTFKQPTNVSAISITGYQHHRFAPKNFEILCDGKVVKKIRNAVYENNFLSLTFPETRCGSLELKITASHGPSPAIRELEIYNLGSETPAAEKTAGSALPAKKTSPSPIKKEGKGKTIQIALVTGGHGFNKEEFLDIFDKMKGIEYTHVELKDHSEIFEDIAEWPYDVIVFYHMTQNISEKRRKNFLALLDRGVGVVALHHAAGAFQEWPEYKKIIGVKYYLKAREENGVQHEKSTFKHDVQLDIQVKDDKHPITRGLRGFTILDEAYGKCGVEPDNQILLTAGHPLNNKTVCWVRQYGKARVCYLQLGHDNHCYKQPVYRKLVERAIQWCSEKPKQ